MSNSASEGYKDMVDPGWREREAEMHRLFSEAIPKRSCETSGCKYAIDRRGLAPQCVAGCREARKG
jgi:hypothetical protein